MSTTITPRLIVSDAAKAIDFYVDALDATEVSRHADPGGAIVHAELTVGGASFTLKDETPGTTDLGPASFGGTPVILNLTVDDVDALGARMERAGATVIFPIDEHPYGKMGRFADPFGHIWMIAQAS
ncbi:MAG: VOC family protein [Streptosporangiales bacterium]|nr:VOC family protein [Streptosporangiales bacterium]